MIMKHPNFEGMTEFSLAFKEINFCLDQILKSLNKKDKKHAGLEQSN